LGRKLIRTLQALLNNIHRPFEKCRSVTSLVLNFPFKKLPIRFVDSENFYNLEQIAIPSINAPKIFKLAIDTLPYIRIRTLEALVVLKLRFFQQTRH